MTTRIYAAPAVKGLRNNILTGTVRGGLVYFDSINVESCCTSIEDIDYMCPRVHEVINLDEKQVTKLSRVL